MMHKQIPCRTATRGSFPLNGTYFQVNEVSLLKISPILYIFFCQHILSGILDQATILEHMYISSPCRYLLTMKPVYARLKFLDQAYGV